MTCCFPRRLGLTLMDQTHGLESGLPKGRSSEFSNGGRCLCSFCWRSPGVSNTFLNLPRDRFDSSQLVFGAV